MIVLLFALFIAVLAMSILRERTEAIKRTEDRVLSASQVVATNARWVSELSRQALSRIDYALGQDINASIAGTEGLIRDAVSSLPGNVKCYIVAANGRTLFSTDPEVRPIDVRDRPYFQSVANGEQWYVSPLLISRLNGNQIFVFSKRIERNGAFVGAAIISFDVELFRDVWESLEFDDFSTVSLVRQDGQLVARYPFADAPLDLSNYELFTTHLTQSDAGTYPAISPSDGAARIVGYRRVHGTPFVALASLSTDRALKEFRRNTLITLAFALPTALALAGAIIWLLRLLRQDETRRRQLVEALELNRMLVRDTHHRVKNNLQAIMSMVRMHPLPTTLKSDLQNRISAMSAVHEHLYRLDQFHEVSAASLVPGIIEPLREGFAQPVTFDYQIAPIVLDRDHATPLALMLSEVVTNALKYAFPDGRTGKISVSLALGNDNTISLTVVDDGVGFDPDKIEKGLGSRIIRAMAVQLGAEYAYSGTGGTRFVATFRDPAAYKPKDGASPAQAAAELRSA